MRSYGRSISAGFVILFLAAFGAGCGSESSAPPTASIGTNSQSGGGGTAEEPPSKADLLHPIVVIETSLGEITVKLDAEAAPGTVSNFLHYLNSSHYQQTIFHYVDKDMMILGGGFTADGTPRPIGPPIRNEAHNGLKNKKGTIAMSRSFEDIDSATSQFFINVNDNPSLDYAGEDPDQYGYCVFGEVIDGMNVVEKIAAVGVHDSEAFTSTPIEPVVIRSMHVVR